MNAQQGVVGLGGIALVAANYWTTGRQAINPGLFNNSATAAQQSAAHAALKNVALELLFVGVVTMLAGISSSWGSAMVAVVIALAILWSIKHFSTQGSN